MIKIDLNTGLDLKFKVNLTGTTFEQLSAWAAVEPKDGSVVYQIPVTIENGVLSLKSDFKDIKLDESGQIKIQMQHGDTLHNVWSSEYATEKKIEIVLEQIVEAKVEKKEEKKVIKTEKVVEKPAVKVVENKIEKTVKNEKPVEVLKKTEKIEESTKIKKFYDY